MSDETIFAAALEKADPAERTAFLDDACRDDPDRRRRVDGLLAAHEQAGEFLARPAVAPPAPAAAPTRAYGEAADTDPTRTFGAGHTPPDDEALGFLKPSARPDSLGRIGHYEVLEVLGRGGFGIVFRAFDDVLQRVVAVKMLAPQMAATSPARKRFTREARSAAAIQHENVVRVHAVEESPLPYLVMEFIPGETLQQRLDRTGPLAVPEVLRIGRQVAEGLAAAHAQGLVHRDIKPANVLLEAGPQERVKLTDFGLARAADDASISQSGVVAGTPMYMAPEQAKGETLDHRADLFSLGSVLYAMLTGRPPFRATTTLAVLKRVAEDTPRPIREVIPEVPDWLCRIVEKLHAKDPAGRFQSAREVADVLADCEAQLIANARLTDFSRIPAAKPAPRRHRRWVNWAAGAAAVLLAGLGVAVGPTAVTWVKGLGGSPVAQPKPGVLDLRLSDTAMHYRIDGHGADQTAVSGVQLPLEAGEHYVWFRRGDRAYRTAPFLLTSGEETRLELEVTAAGGAARLNGKPLTATPLSGDSPPSAEGFVRLFNGTDLTGWQSPPGRPSHWTVTDGVLVGTGPEQNYLYSARGDYRDFHLRVEARVNDAGNSGIHFRVAPPRGKTGGTPPGYEVQIAGRSADPTPTGSLMVFSTRQSLLSRVPNPPVPADTWFTQEVIARGRRIVVKVNGQVLVDHDHAGPEVGHLALQVLNGATRVEFRRIEIKELPPGPPAAPPAAVAPFDAAKAKELQAAWAKHLGLAPEVTNSLGMKLRLIPPGEFLIGSPPEDIAASRQELKKQNYPQGVLQFVEFVESRSGPQRAVKLTKPYYLGAHEVTVADFRRFVTETGYRTLAEQTAEESYWEKPGWTAAVDPRHPVTYLAWADAQAFCAWLSKREGRTYRLPTEAEWEFACRAGTTTRWNWGDDPAQFLHHAWFNRPLPGGPGKVGEKRPNAFGLYDMHGNAEEWCADWHLPLQGIAPVDPHATEQKDAVGRVVRGGFAFDIPELGRSGRRSYTAPDKTTSIALGFRVALVGDLKPKPAPPPAEVAPAPRRRP